MQPDPSPEARWEDLSAALPATPEAYLNVLKHLVEKGDFQVVEAGFAAILEHYPNHPAVNSRYARAAEQRGDWPEAARRWERAHARHRHNQVVVQALAAAWVRTGQADKADALLAAALAKTENTPGRAADPTIRRMLIDRARLATSRRDFTVARQRWQELEEQLPGDAVVRNGVLEMNTLMRLESVDAGHDGPMPAPPTGRPAPHADLMLRFEGLGGTCEVGLVQRHFGAEPLGLLRWVSLTSENLCQAVNRSLDGIGDAEFTRIGLSAANDFYTNDTRYGLAMHTFIRNSGQDQSALLTQLQRRMRFLRGKLLEDMQAGEKIFVYRCRQPGTKDDLALLSGALRAHNPANLLLAIRMLPHGTPAEPVRWAAPNVLCGAIADGRPAGNGSGWAIDYGAWLQACQSCVELVAERNKEDN